MVTLIFASSIIYYFLIMCQSIMKTKLWDSLIYGTCLFVLFATSTAMIIEGHLGDIPS